MKLSSKEVLEEVRFGINRDDLTIYTKESDSYSSWIVEDLSRWGSENNYSVTFVIDNWVKLEKDFKRGDIDAIYPANHLKIREEYMSFTKVIKREPFSIFSPKEESIVSLEGLKEKRIGTLNSELLKKELTPFFNDINYYHSTKGGINGLHDRRIDYFIAPKGTLNNYPDTLFPLGDLWFDNEGSIGVQKNKPEILSTLNRHFFTRNLLKKSIEKHIKEEEIKTLQQAIHKKLRVRSPVTLNMVIHKDTFPFVEIKNNMIKSPILDVINQFNSVSEYIQINPVPPEDQYSFNEELKRLEKGEIHIMAPIGRTKKRDNTYTRVYESTMFKEDALTLLSHSSSSVVSRLYEIRGTLGTVNSHLLEEIAYSNLPSENIVVYEDRKKALKDLNNGKIEYLLDTEKIVQGFILLKNYSNIRKLFSLDKFTYALYLAPDINSNILYDLRLITDSLKNRWMFEASQSSSVAPKFTIKYLIQIKLLLILILVITVFSHRKHRIEKLEKDKILKALIGSLENVNHVNNEETGEHIVRIGLYSEVISKTLNLPKKLTSEIKLFASLHDVGKVAIPREILSKPGKLTHEEFEVMKTHTEIGREIIENLSGIPSKAELATNIVLYHHERWDGNGYPHQLTGEGIPLEARIVTLADVYDALRMPRVYKKGLSHQESYDIIVNGSGSHFDPQMIEIFKKKHLDFNNIYMNNS